MNKKTGKKIIATFLSSVMAASAVCIPLPFTQSGGEEIKAAEVSVPTLTVQMDEGTRALKHGAAGWLYGLADEEVPASSLITPLKANTAVQKAPNGMQHPDGDVLETAKTFLRAGGKNLQIYVPDYYALWGYEFTGTDQYLKILKMEAQACIDAGIAEDVSYVLYNEPGSNWIGAYHDSDGNKVTGWNAMYWFWLDMVETLRAVYRKNGVASEPKTVGLNLSTYQPSTMASYMKFCAEHDCVPDIISWHDLSESQFKKFDSEYTHYRNLEKELGLEEHEIVINEYADFTDCSSPGNLACWIGLWEEYNVSGCLPFWHLSNNLNGLAADANEGNGAWWLYKWYGDMSGNYLPVTAEGAEKCDFYGTASLDENKNCANVLFGGQSGDGKIILSGVTDTDAFRDAEKIHVKIESTDYTGFHGAADEPHVLKEGTLPVTDGTVTVPMEDLNALSAYRITLTKASEQESSGLSDGNWRAVYEAENGSLAGSASIRKVTSSVPCSNQQIVSGIKTAKDSVTVTVDVPADGYYKYDMVYAAGDGVNTQAPKRNYPYPAENTLSVDGRIAEEIVLPNTLSNSMAGMYSTYLPLSQGIHEIQICGTAASKSSSNVDCIYLTYAGAEEGDTEFSQIYEAELADFNTLSGRQDTVLTTAQNGSISYVENLHKSDVPSGGGLRFTAVVPDNGMYELSLRYQAKLRAKARIYIGNDAIHLGNLCCEVPLPETGAGWVDASRTVFLQKGVNIIDIDTVGEIGLDSVTVGAAKGEEERKPIADIEAEDGFLSGEAELGTNETTAKHSSGGSYVSGIKAANGSELILEGDGDYTVAGMARYVDLGEAPDKNNLQINVSVPEDGEYKLVVYQSNGELFGKHSYNFQMVERYAVFQVNDGEKKKIVFRNTYSDASFKPQVVTLSLKKGENAIKIYNDNSKIRTNGVLKSGKTEHIPENIDYSVLTNYTPNFDRFVLYPALTGPVFEEESGGDTGHTQNSPGQGGAQINSQTVINQKTDISGSGAAETFPAKGKKYTVGDYQYKILKSSSKMRAVSIVKSLRKNIKRIVIPEKVTIKGRSYFVTKIEAKAFRAAQTAKSVTVHSRRITSVGKQAFSGIWKRAKIKVPPKKLNAYRKLFKNKIGKKMKIVKK